MIAKAPGLGDTLMNFISLGLNCEFGLVQRYCRAEPVDLFRFGYCPLPDLIEQLDNDFSAFRAGAPLDLDTDGRRTEYLSFVPGTKIGFHTTQPVTPTSAGIVASRESRRLGLLARKLREELANSGRICVYVADHLQAGDAFRLHDSLKRYGPVRLLVVTRRPPPFLPGSVVKLQEGLLIGSIDRVTRPDFARILSLDVWLALLRTALDVFAAPVARIGEIVEPDPAAFTIPDEVINARFWNALAAIRRGEFALAFRIYRDHWAEFDADDGADVLFTDALRSRAGWWGAHQVYAPRPSDQSATAG